MKRLGVILAVVVLLAGCTAGGPATTERDQPATTPSTATTATSTTSDPASPGACDAAVPSTVDPIRESVTPGSFPDRPEDLTAETVESFVREYERTYKRNEILGPDTRDAGVSVTVQDVTSVDGGYLVTLETRYYENVADVVTTGTATVVHADSPMYTVRYFLSEDRLHRTESADYRETPADPREGGTTLECWG